MPRDRLHRVSGASHFAGMSERERDREEGPRGKYGGSDREASERRRDGDGSGSSAEQYVPQQRKIELVQEARKRVEADSGELFGSRYTPQVLGVKEGCDDDPGEVYLACMERDARRRRGAYVEYDKGDGDFEQPRPWYTDVSIDAYLASQATIRRQMVMYDLQQAIARDVIEQNEARRARKEEEERVERKRRENERKRAKQVEREAKEAAKAPKGWDHDDYAEGRVSMRQLLWGLKKSSGACAQALYGETDLLRHIFGYVRANCFKDEWALRHRLMDFMLADDKLFRKFGTNINEVDKAFNLTLGGGVRYAKENVLMYPSARMVPVVRLFECAELKNPGSYLWSLARYAADYVEKTEKVEDTNIEKYELFDMFESAVDETQPYGGPLWLLSTKPRKNMSLFRKVEVDGMKEKWPRAGHAIRILEVAHKNRWMLDLAMHAADTVRGRRARAAELAKGPTLHQRYWSW